MGALHASHYLWVIFAFRSSQQYFDGATVTCPGGQILAPVIVTFLFATLDGPEWLPMALFVAVCAAGIFFFFFFFHPPPPPLDVRPVLCRVVQSRLQAGLISKDD